MKRIACFIFLTSLLSLASCQKPIVLENETFTAQETAEWELFLQRFDEAICEVENKRSRAACWQSFFERMQEQARDGDLSVKIPEEKHAYILAALSPELQDDTWGIAVSYPFTRNHVTGEKTTDTIPHLGLKQEKYFRFLTDEVKDLSPRTEFYVSMFQEVNDVSPSVFADVIMKYQEYNIEDDRIRLLLAVHYFTLNDRQVEKNKNKAN